MKIIKYNPVNKGAVTCSFTISIPKWANFQIRNILLMESNGKKWISMPSQSYEDKQTGKKKYYAYLGFEDREVNDKFHVEIIKVLENYIASMIKEDQTKPQGSGLNDDELPF